MSEKLLRLLFSFSSQMTGYLVILLKSEFLNVNPLMSPKKIRLLNLKINITLKIVVVVGLIVIVRCC